MNEVAEVTPLTTLRPMIIFARYRPVVAHLYNLIFNFLLFLNFLNVLIFESLYLSPNALNSILMVESHLYERHVIEHFFLHLIEGCHLGRDHVLDHLFLLFKLIYNN